MTRLRALALLGLAGALAVGLRVTVTPTQAAWSSGALTDPAASAAAGSLEFGHSYGSTCTGGPRVTANVSCAGTLAPTTASSGSGAVTGSNTISNVGSITSGRLTQTLTAASCAPVKFTNAKTAANPLLARNAMTFHTSGGPMTSSGYATLSGGYATSVVAGAQPPTGALSAGRFSGVGVWFKAANGVSGPLMSFGASPAAGGGNADRVLMLTATGTLKVIWNTSGDSITTSGTNYADGTWHFAYMTFGGINVAIIGLIPEVILYVDGASRASTPLISLNPLSSYSGYWHLGYAPTSVTGLGSATFSGDVSNAVVLNTGVPPTGTTIGTPASQAAFDTAISANVSEQWTLADDGTGTFAGTLPATMTAPCGQLTVSASFTSPAGSITSQTLTSLADGVARTISAAAPGGSQSMTLSVTRGGGYNTDISGLRLRVPITMVITTNPASATWTLTFTWTSAGAVFLA